jgi:hypothetical protein
MVAADQGCRRQAGVTATQRTANVPNAVRVIYAATEPFWGVPSPPARFVFALVPPKGQ